jgi:hypothetical protein
VVRRFGGSAALRVSRVADVGGVQTRGGRVMLVM